ncbi:hypothetical protein RhiirA5_435175 [Rhizophagus irregularis]|uniref:Uncharacterized protein n=1 Tax=Rhizophagus irregularis TaxID=588596 RepID=A0A2N0NNT7_9GLOM|nr:hypothetical protein RhiirA5_435175 [Rhizophagus irregularis]
MPDFSLFDLFYFTGKHKKEQLSVEKLDGYVKEVESCVSQLWASAERWKQFVFSVLDLCHNARKYIKYLEVNQSVKENHLSVDFIRNKIDNILIEIREKKESFDKKYDDISSILHNSDYYELISLDTYLSDDKRARYDFILNLEVDSAFTLYQYYHGNYLGTLNFIWKLPDFDDRSKTKESQLILLANKMVPIFFTRQMKKNVIEKYSLIAKLTPSIWNKLLQDLSGDSSSSSNELTKEMQDRIQTVLDLQDPEIILDLRIVPAVHDRRASSVLYLPIAMSISDLKKIIIQKLESKYGAPLNSEICIPSDEYIRLQFWPKNPATQTASQYTGRFNIKYKIQTRQLSKFHPDAHYCAALFQYMRLFSIKFRKYTSFICADDKHKIAIGEGIATSTGVRNKKSLVPQNVDLTSSDHDYTKLSLTPSVTLFIDIPESINESFYHGQVYVSYKDTTFQPSTAIRHATEIYNNIKKQHQENLPEMLLLSPDRHHLHDYANVVIPTG